jgi:hypothetical protein
LVYFNPAKLYSFCKIANANGGYIFTVGKPIILTKTMNMIFFSLLKGMNGKNAILQTKCKTSLFKNLFSAPWVQVANSTRMGSLYNQMSEGG